MRLPFRADGRAAPKPRCASCRSSDDDFPPLKTSRRCSRFEPGRRRGTSVRRNLGACGRGCSRSGCPGTDDVEPPDRNAHDLAPASPACTAPRGADPDRRRCAAPPDGSGGQPAGGLEAPPERFRHPARSRPVAVPLLPNRIGARAGFVSLAIPARAGSGRRLAGLQPSRFPAAGTRPQRSLGSKQPPSSRPLLRHPRPGCPGRRLLRGDRKNPHAGARRDDQALRSCQ